MTSAHSGRFRTAGTTLLAAVLGAALPAVASAQYETVPPPAVFALEDVTVVQGDGDRSEGVTIVVRRGTVEALGPDVEVPPDARVLAGEGLHVYPGLVDPFGHATMDLPSPDREGVAPWDPPRDVQGFTPHRAAADYLAADGSDLKSQREDGVVASGVFPPEGMMPGQGALLLHRPGAEEPRRLVLRSPLGLSLQLRGSAGSYPATLFGVIAHLRQAFLDAERHGTLLAEFERDPRGLDAPPPDGDYHLVRQVTEGRLPVFVRAERAEEVRRALGLADELGFRPVLVGGDGAWRVADRLAEEDVPVLVSVNFPEPSEWDPDEEGALSPAAQREREELENLYANAARLRDAGVRVAFMSERVRGDLRDGARKAVAHGLGADDAIRALTLEPATLLGAPHLGEIAPGGGATFIVTDGPLLGAETEVLYTFVEGAMERKAEPEEFTPEDVELPFGGEER